MPNYKAGIEFKATDKLSKQVAKMTNKMNKLSKATGRANKNAMTMGSTFKSVLSAGLVQRGLSLVTQGVTETASSFLDYEQAIVGAGTRFKDIDNSAKNFTAQLDGIKKAARDAGATTEYTATQSAEALDFLARAGFNSKEAIQALVPMINLATASGEEFTNVADWSSDILGAFGMEAENTADKIANLKRVNDNLSYSANSANVTIENMFETFKMSAPIAKTLGADIEELSALTMTLGNAGIKGTQSGTALKNVFLAMTDSASKGGKVLKKLGVQTKDSSGNMLKMTDILAQMSGKMKKMGNVEQAKALKDIFGKIPIAGASVLLDKIGDLRSAYQGLTEDAKGSTKQTAELMRQTAKMKLATLKSALTDKAFTVFDAFLGKFKDGISGLTDRISKFSTDKIVSGIESFINGVKTIASVVSALTLPLRTIIGIFDKMGISLDTLLIPFIAFKTGMLAFKFAGMISGLIGMTGGMAGFNAMVSANPLGAFVAVVMGTITALNLLESKFKIFTKAREGIQNYFGLDKSKSLGGNIMAGLGFGDDEKTEAKATTSKASVQSDILSQAVPVSVTKSSFNGKLSFENAPKNLKMDSLKTGGNLDLAIAGLN